MSKRLLKLFLGAAILLAAFLLSLHGAEAKLRVVSLSPSLTELIAALGAEESLVGRSSACDFPETVKKLPVAGDFAIPNLELLATLRADLVVADTLVDAGMAETIRGLGMRFELLPLKTLTDYPAAARKLGELLDKKLAGETEAKAFEDAVAALDKNPVKHPVKVLLLFSDDPPITCGKDSFLTQYVRMAGGESVTGDVAKSYFKVSPEYLLLHEAELIVMPAATDRDGNPLPLALPEALKNLKAVRENRIWHKPDTFGLSRLGPRWREAVKTLKEAFAEAKNNRPAGKEE